METKKLLIRTAFACMACDGEVDEREVELVKKFIINDGLCDADLLEPILNELIQEFNTDGLEFMSSFFALIEAAVLSREEQLTLVRYAIEVIQADEVVDYKEIKFFKTIRSFLSISDEEIIESLGDVSEYLEKDISSRSYLDALRSKLSKFDKISPISVVEVKND